MHSMNTLWFFFHYLQCGECCIKLFFLSNVNIFLDGAAALLISICQASSCTSSCSRLMPCCWVFKALLMSGTSSTLKSSTPHKSRCANGTEKWLWSRLSVVEPELVSMSYVHDWCHHLTTQVRIHLTNLRMWFFSWWHVLNKWDCMAEFWWSKSELTVSRTAHDNYF